MSLSSTQNGPATRARLMERCRRLGAPACAITASGHIVAVTPLAPELESLMRSPPIVAAISVCSVDGVGELATYELFPGARLIVVPTPEGPTHQGRVGALLLSPGALNDPEFSLLCAAAGVDASTARAALGPSARFDAFSVNLVAEALLSSSMDLTELEEHADALEGFTQQLSESYDTIDLLYSLGRSMPKPDEPERFLQTVATRLQSVMAFEWLAIVMLSNGPSVSMRGRLIPAGRLPLPAADLRAMVTPLVPASESPVVLPRVERLSVAGSPQVVAQAIHCKGRVTGAIFVGGKGGRETVVSSYDLQLIEATAGYLSSFAENVTLYEDQNALFLGTLRSLTAAIDAKDRYTCGHSERVACLARAIALAGGLSPALADRIHIAGLVHDVGKIGVPEAVLCKPGKLTDDEFALIKLHPQIGHRILKDIAQFADVLPGVLHHHERFDGRGYPHGLGGEKIPLVARVLAVADTFDAMSSNRSYRPALTRERVMEEIVRSAGTQLDPTFSSLVPGLDLREFDRMLAEHKALSIRAAA
ncbi:MAG: HD-GYP domain-containing protein [Phycisphaerales bacterium]